MNRQEAFRLRAYTSTAEGGCAVEIRMDQYDTQIVLFRATTCRTHSRAQPRGGSREKFRYLRVQLTDLIAILQHQHVLLHQHSSTNKLKSFIPYFFVNFKMFILVSLCYDLFTTKVAV